MNRRARSAPIIDADAPRVRRASARSILPALKLAQGEKGYLTTEDLAAVGGGGRRSPRPTSRASPPSTTVLYLTPVGKRRHLRLHDPVLLAARLRRAAASTSAPGAGRRTQGETTADGQITLQEVRVPRRLRQGPLPAGRRRGGARPDLARATADCPDRRAALRRPGPDRLQAVGRCRSCTACSAIGRPEGTSRRSATTSGSGGYAALKQALSDMTPDELLDAVKALRPARPRRRGLPDRAASGASCRRTPSSRSTSCATPTRASRAPSRTARSWSRTPTS